VPPADAGQGGRHLVVVGSMAVGKSTVGSLLAERLGRPFHDSDDDLQTSAGQTGRELAATKGVATLHRWEASHLLDALALPEPAVIAAAASVVDDPHCVEALSARFVAWLRARPETELRRLAGDHHRRSLGDNPVAVLGALLDQRAPLYAAVADIIVDVDDVAPQPIADAILAAFTRTEPDAASDAV
jgi:shikimate kinase